MIPSQSGEGDFGNIFVLLEFGYQLRHWTFNMELSVQLVKKIKADRAGTSILMDDYKWSYSFNTT